MSRIVAAFTVLFLGLTGAGAGAQEADGPWYFRADFQGLLGQYSGSEERDSLNNFGFFLRSDYLERAGFTVGYNRTTLKFNGSDTDIDQDNIFASGKVQLTPDWAPGRITLRIDGHFVSNNDPSNESGVTVIAPLVSYLSNDKTFYVDLGYAQSSYDDSVLIADELDVDQFTPTLGFGFNEQRDWLQLRGYLIDLSSSARAQGVEDTAAIEAKWTHWFSNSKPLGIDNFRLAAVAGERLFAVDPDAGLTYNLTDLQTGGLSLGSEWRLSERNQVLLVLGAEEFENEAINDDYRNVFVYLNFTHQWK